MKNYCLFQNCNVSNNFFLKEKFKYANEVKERQSSIIYFRKRKKAKLLLEEKSILCHFH